MATTVYDCIVVGAGVEGSATAYKLAESGQRTLLLEQFSLLHGEGSSHGGSRITRYSYPDKGSADLAVDNFDEWHKVEKLCGQTLYVKAGLVYMGRKPCPEVDGVIENLRRKEIPHRVLTGGDQLRQVLPNSVYGDEFYGVHEQRAGVLLASKAVGCLQELVRKFGGEIQDNCEVVDIVPGVPLVTVTTKDGRQFQTKNLLLCPGTWAGQLCSKLGLDLPFTLIRCSALYWKEKVAGSHSIQNGQLAFVDTSDSGSYGVPSLEHPGYMKVAIHGGYEYDVANPEEHDQKEPYNLQLLKKYIEDHLPGLDASSPAIVDKCKYTMTPDERFILDRHPAHKNIFLAVGFSGTGFKMAPIIGNILRNLVLGEPQKYDLDCFRLDRFDKSTASTH